MDEISKIPFIGELCEDLSEEEMKEAESKMLDLCLWLEEAQKDQLYRQAHEGSSSD